MSPILHSSIPAGGRTKALYAVNLSWVEQTFRCLRITLRVLLDLDAVVWQWWLQSSFSVVLTPTCLCTETASNGVPFMLFMAFKTCLLCDMCVTKHLTVLNSSCRFTSHLHRDAMSRWSILQSSMMISLYKMQSSAKNRNGDNMSAWISFIKTRNKIRWT